MPRSHAERLLPSIRNKISRQSGKLRAVRSGVAGADRTITASAALPADAGAPTANCDRLVCRLSYFSSHRRPPQLAPNADGTPAFSAGVPVTVVATLIGLFGNDDIPFAEDRTHRIEVGQ